MLKIKKNIIKKDLVLIGAGHANIEVIRYLGKRKIDGLRITLISKNYNTTYSGMVPGYIEGIYEWDEINIDLIQLSLKYNINIIVAKVLKISSKENKVFLKDRAPIEFDLLSINLGIISNTKNILGANRNAFFLKPISEINNTLTSILNSQSKNIVIVGAGAAGVEVALALKERFNKRNIHKNIILISKNSILMKNYSSNVRIALKNELLKKNINILFNSTVTKINKTNIEINGAKKLKSSCTILATDALPPEVVSKSDLKISKNGFISVQDTLQTKNDPNIFAAGDIADIENYKLVKAGVYAVRQSNTLKINLERVLKNKKLIKFIPQKSYLSIIGITKNKALGNKYFFTMKGRALWKLKKNIDKRFIKKYTDFFVDKKNIILDKKSKEPSDYMMQCGGCGSKIPQTVLEKIFEKNFQEGSFDANEITGEKKLVHTIDIISSIVDDLFLLGKIAAKHSLNDIIAANSNLLSAQMMLGIPLSLNKIQKRDIYQLKEGANAVFHELGNSVSGGHSYSLEEGKCTIGFSLIGKKNQILKKQYNKEKLNIYMTGKVGTALVIAGIKNKIISGKFYNEVIKEMTSSNKQIYQLLKKNKIHNITDISGFGLALHLKNLLLRNPHFKGANIYLKKISILEGAKHALENNVLSSLTYSNKDSINNVLQVLTKEDKYLNILFDPQTAGGFLFVTNEKNKIIQDLKKNKIIFSEIGNISYSHNKIKVL
jgi:selenide,water dikinase